MNLELNVVRFENEDVIATSHENYVTLEFNEPHLNGSGASRNWHVDPKDIEVGTKIIVDGATYNVVYSSGAQHNTLQEVTTTGINWTIINTPLTATTNNAKDAIAAKFGGYYTYDAATKTYTKVH